MRHRGARGGVLLPRSSSSLGRAPRYSASLVDGGREPDTRQPAGAEGLRLPANACTLEPSIAAGVAFDREGEADGPQALPGTGKGVVARKLGISCDTLYRWIRNRELERDLETAPLRYDARRPHTNSILQADDPCLSGRLPML
mgnify:CR=1 FL=1